MLLARLPHPCLLPPAAPCSACLVEHWCAMGRYHLEWMACQHTP